jgi:hypothetical protein
MPLAGGQESEAEAEPGAVTDQDVSLLLAFSRGASLEVGSTVQPLGAAASLNTFLVGILRRVCRSNLRRWAR